MTCILGKSDRIGGAVGMMSKKEVGKHTGVVGFNAGCVACQKCRCVMEECWRNGPDNHMLNSVYVTLIYIWVQSKHSYNKAR